MLLAAVGANCSVLNLSFQAVSPFAISFICSQYLTELKLDGVVGVTSADVQRFGDNCPMLRVSHSKHFCPSTAPTSTACLVCLTHAAHVLSLEHCNAIDDAAFAFDLAINLQDVNVSYCVQLTDVGVLRLLSCSPRLQTLNMSASATSFPPASNLFHLNCPTASFLYAHQSVTASYQQRKPVVSAQSLPLYFISQHSLLVSGLVSCIAHFLIFRHLRVCSSNVSSVASQALPVMLPNAKFVGIESLGFGIGDMAHLQVKRRLPDADVAHNLQSMAQAASPGLPAPQGQTSRALTAARRVFNTVRLSAHASKEAEERVGARIQGRDK